jgi:hypothetical protein
MRKSTRKNLEYVTKLMRVSIQNIYTYKRILMFAGNPGIMWHQIIRLP